MTTRIRVQFDDDSRFLDVPEMPRIGEGLVMPVELDPLGKWIFRVIDVAQYPHQPDSIRTQLGFQRADVRVAGDLTNGPREPQP